MWPSTSKLEKIAKDNGRVWTGPKARNLTKHEIIPSISRISESATSARGSGTCDGSSDS